MLFNKGARSTSAVLTSLALLIQEEESVSLHLVVEQGERPIDFENGIDLGRII